jgi:CheY-like chemotaxis protein
MVMPKASESLGPSAPLRTQVLVVDDDASVCRAICRRLKEDPLNRSIPVLMVSGYRSWLAVGICIRQMIFISQNGLS